MLNRPLLLASALLLFGAPLAAQTTVTLTATDTDCIATTGQNWVDNRLRAYWSTSLLNVDGFMKFDLSSIPDGSAITSMKLTTFHEYGFGNPAYDPAVRLYRVAADGWSRANSGDAHPGLNEALTPLHQGSFPVNDLVPYVWDIDVNAANWQTDLTDDVLSLAMSNETGIYSYVYWYGSDASPAPPQLEVTYGGRGPRLSVQNLVAGSAVTITVDNATPGGVVRHGYSVFGAGPTTTPYGNLLLSPPYVELPPMSANASGQASLSAPVPPGTTGVSVWLHAFDIGSLSFTNGVAAVIG